MYNEQKITLQS